MPCIRIFQTLVLFSVVLHFSWLLLPSGDWHVSPETHEALRWSGHGGVQLLQHPAFYIVAAAAKLVASIGLVLFKAWGRWLLVLLVAVSLAQLPFNGIAVALPHETSIGALAGLVDGAVLALAFSLGSAGRAPAR